MGSVILVKKDVNAIPKSIPATDFIFSFLAAGRANIIVGKKPVINVPAIGFPAKNLEISPVPTLPALSVNKLN